MFDSIVSYLLIPSLIASVLWAALYLLTYQTYNYWSSRGIKGPKPYPLIGTLYRIFSKPFYQVLDDGYKEYGPIYGGYHGLKPVLAVADPELIKDIYIKDFHIFVDRNNITTGDPINDRSLFAVRGDEWRQLRAIISPAFSSGKMRKMHPLIDGCVKRLIKEFTSVSKNTNNELEIKDLMGKFTMDVIATCAFGTKVDTYNDKNNQFLKNAELVFKPKVWRIMLFFFFQFCLPKFIADKIQFLPNDPDCMNFFRSAIRSIIGMRKEKSSAKSVDFLQLMIDAQKRVDIHEKEDVLNETESIYGRTESAELSVGNKTKIDVTEDDILATSFLFFIAGFETTASLLAFLSYSLALHEECQQKLYIEVQSLENKFDYESIAKMPYLDACIAETLRLYSSVGAMSRISSQDYMLGNTGITIPKGMHLQVNVQSVHHNPQYYPNPSRFDPERFMPDNRHKLTPNTYLPFSLGPRNCVGMRFALMEAKTAIVNIVNEFKLVRTENTKVPLNFVNSFILKASDITIGVQRR